LHGGRHLAHFRQNERRGDEDGNHGTVGRAAAGRDGSGPEANICQILGHKGEIYRPESGLDRVMLVDTGKPG
jgi:hypothetical protein